MFSYSSKCKWNFFTFSRIKLDDKIHFFGLTSQQLEYSGLDVKVTTYGEQLYREIFLDYGNGGITLSLFAKYKIRG